MSPDDPSRTLAQTPTLFGGPVSTARDSSPSGPGATPELLPSTNPDGPSTVVQVGVPLILHGHGMPAVPGYEVHREIARGGMGLVIAARDPSLGRDVAIKILLPDHATATAARRFVGEAKITARLPHPAIPPVHQLGTLPDGNPFLAMKLIRGRTLADELKVASRPADVPRLVHVYEQVAQAVGFAHAEGVVHRDLKPANIMVGAFGEVLVMDWGLAKVVSSPDGDRGFAPDVTAGDDRPPDVTRAGAVMGTPAYMAPEQARGEMVGPPADVFALGGILCDILTGSPPFGGPTLRDTLRLAAAGDVTVALSRLDGCGADPELVALCKSCLCRRVDGRPADGKAVADAVAIYRAGVEGRLRRAETDRAAAEARAEEEANTRREAEARALERRKRRRVQAVLAGAVAVILGLIGVGAWWQDRQAEQQALDHLASDARAARSETARIKAEAVAARQERDVRERVDRNRDAAAILLAETEAALRASNAERAAAAFSQVERRVAEGGADVLADQVARCRKDLSVLQELDGIDTARWAMRGGQIADGTGIALRTAAAFAGYGITPGTTPPADAARVINGSMIRERLLTSLEVWFVSGGPVASLRAILSAADPDEFRDMARATSYERAALTRAFRGAKGPIAQPVWFVSAHGQDRRVPRPAREQLLATALRSRPGNFTLLMDIGDAYEVVDRESALRSAAWFRAAVAVQPGNPAAWHNLGNALRSAGDLSAAVTAYTEAARLDPLAVQPRNNLGIALQAAGDLPGAIAAYRKAAELDPKAVLVHNNLAQALLESGDAAGAVASYRRAAELDPGSAAARLGLANLLHDSGDLWGAVAVYREAVRLDPTSAAAHTALGVGLRDIGDPRGAVLEHREAIRLSPRYALAYHNLGVALRESGDVDGAIAAYKEALRLDPKLVVTYFTLGNALHEAGDEAGAIAAYKEAVRLDPTDVKTHVNLVLAYVASKQYRDAIATAREAVRLDPRVSHGHAVLGIALFDSGDEVNGRAAFREAVRLDPKRWEPLFRQRFSVPVAPAPREAKR